MITAKYICDQIGRQRIASCFGVGVTTVSNAVVANKFSASWFDALEKMCIEEGILCPRDLFSFRQVGTMKEAG